MHTPDDVLQYILTFVSHDVALLCTLELVNKFVKRFIDEQWKTILKNEFPSSNGIVKNRAKFALLQMRRHIKKKTYNIYRPFFIVQVGTADYFSKETVVLRLARISYETKFDNIMEAVFLLLDSVELDLNSDACHETYSIADCLCISYKSHDQVSFDRLCQLANEIKRVKSKMGEVPCYVLLDNRNCHDSPFDGVHDESYLCKLLGITEYRQINNNNDVKAFYQEVSDMVRHYKLGAKPKLWRQLEKGRKIKEKKTNKCLTS